MYEPKTTPAAPRPIRVRRPPAAGETPVSRRLRHVPKGEPYENGTLVEVTCRTIHGRYLLRPSAELNDIVIGVLGYAQQSCPISICGISVLSNHYHLLAVVKETDELSDFMCLFNSNLAREVARLVGWPDKVWARRYQGIVVSDEEEAQIKRLKYLLAHGAKEALVDHPGKWPGVNSVRALLHGEALRARSKITPYSQAHLHAIFGRSSLAKSSN